MNLYGWIALAMHVNKRFKWFQRNHRITRPDYFIVADELGGNISQKGDGHAGGTRLICKKG